MDKRNSSWYMADIGFGGDTPEGPYWKDWCALPLEHEGSHQTTITARWMTFKRQGNGSLEITHQADAVIAWDELPESSNLIED